MNAQSELRGRLEPLMVALTEGSISDEQTEDLRAILRNDPQARRYYADYMFIHASLAWNETEPIIESAEQATLGRVNLQDLEPALTDLRDGSLSSTTQEAEEANREEIGNLPKVNLSAASMLQRTIDWDTHRIRFGTFSAVLTALAWAGFSYFLWSSTTPDDSRPNRTGNIQYVAEITGQYEHRWAEGMPPMSVRHALLSGERLDLAEGLIEITFDGGAVVVLEGPTDFVVDSSEAGTLESGRLVANVPQEAIGFTVETPTGQVVDLGTQFGIWVDESGDAEVHVFDGKVDAILYNRSGAEVRRMRLTKDQAARIGPEDVALEQITAHAEPFEQLLAAEPGLRLPFDLIRGLVAYYPLDGNANDFSGAGNNMTDKGTAPIGYATGRVGQAVSLDGVDQALEVTGTTYFAGDVATYSWQAWVNPVANVVESDDYILATIERFTIASRIDTSNQWEAFADNAPPPAGGQFESIQSISQGTAAPGGADGWYHILGTWDVSDGLRLYVNGALVGSDTSVVGSAEESFGLHIGADQDVTLSSSSRYFDGEIDEVAIWTRVLTASEIQSLFNDGAGVSFLSEEAGYGTQKGVGHPSQ